MLTIKIRMQKLKISTQNRKSTDLKSNVILHTKSWH